MATDTFVDYVAENPLKLDALNFTHHSAWESLAGQLRKRYASSHWQLINDDPDYRDKLGEVFDIYNENTANDWEKPKANETLVSRRRRYLNEGQKLVKDAAHEGIPTSVAAYGVTPATVRLRLPDLEPTQQLTISEGLLPATGELSRHLARHSKAGNERLLRAIAHVPVRSGINYGHLHYDPNLFDITFNQERERYTLHTVGTYHEPQDLSFYFRGCPAIPYGSITIINKMIADTIIQNNLYGRSIPGAN
jgi:hypothetical protein